MTLGDMKRVGHVLKVPCGHHSISRQLGMQMIIYLVFCFSGNYMGANAEVNIMCFVVLRSFGSILFIGTTCESELRLHGRERREKREGRV